MRALFVFGALCAALLTTSARAAVLVDIPLNQQINVGATGYPDSPLGDAIFVPSRFNERLSFVTEGADTFTRINIAGGNYWYGPYIDFRLAGIGSLTLTDDCLIEFDTRYFQPESNTKRYQDAPVFLTVYSYAPDNTTLLGYKAFGIVQATQPPWNNAPYPGWTHVTVPWSAIAPTNNGSNVFDPTLISRLRFYGTDWYSPKDQFLSFVDVKNFRVSCPDAIPEPGTMALMAMGALPLLGLRRRKA